MIEILTQAATQVPALVVLCLLVYMFVGSLKAERTAIETIASEALNRNTEAMADNQRVLEASVQSLNRKTENARPHTVGGRANGAANGKRGSAESSEVNRGMTKSEIPMSNEGGDGPERERQASFTN